jgi:hypothetical protein
MAGPRWPALLLSAALLVSCSTTAQPSPAPHERSGDLHRAEQHLLDRRARAVRTHDLSLFLGTLDRGDRRLVRQQRRWFANVAQLPLERFRYRLTGDGRHVRSVMQLRGFDAWPVRRTVTMRLGRADGRLAVLAARPGPHPRPWDLTRIHVARAPGVLGIFDRAMWPHAREVLATVAAGRRQVSASVPFSWNDHVVVYCVADERVLDAFDDVPGGGSITHLGAMTFPVYTGEGGGRLAAMRFTVLPSSVRAGQPFLGRIVRHELTHVAVGNRDDGDPVWVSEGIAEYVGARPVAPDQRRIPRVAVERARGGVSAMPASRDFNGRDQEWNYALAWMACDYIATHQGEARLWQLMTALHAHGKGTPDRRQDAVLRRVLGYDSHELARRAAARILSIYG